ncbi:hypothetical protein FXO37_01728 [Capsicum annuum]|nr:hypothetical protein FXO37_01728 [Capsicum annuum]
MDSRSNFSLGLSQLDAEEQNFFVGFVPGIFDYEEPSFAENRSKHRNDPVTIKKLKEVASSSLKKSTSKSTSKKKVDDSGRSRLPRHRESPISLAHFQMIEDGRYRHFPWRNITFDKLMNSWRQDFFVTNQLYSLGEDFEIFDPLPTSADQILKRRAHEDQSCVVTVAEDFDDFNTIPPWKILIKSDLSLPLSTEQASKRRKIVTFQEESPGVKDDEKSTRTHSVRYVSGSFLKNQEVSTDKTSTQFEQIVQDAVDTLLFGLSTPSTTNPLDASTPNSITKSQWTLFDSQCPADFLDAQVREREVTKAPVKRDRKKSRIFRSP